MKVLIVEDFRALAKGLSEVLQAQGHQVQTVIGFRKLETLEAVDLDDQDVTLTDDFDVALVDGCIEQFNGKDNPIEGPAVVTRLVQSGVKCLGISTVDEINATMVANGANDAVNKAVAFAALVGSVISVEDLAADDKSAMQRLHELREIFNTDANKPLRRQCDALIMQHS
jgi:DNA-binding response OmpR family regulator